MTNLITATDNMLLAALRNMYDRREITLQQYGVCLRRARER